MAEMALGYGSEYQLLRFLGHHREEFYDAILHSIGNKDGDIIWLDYPYNSDRYSGDGELKGVDCFKKRDDYTIIEKQWKDYWPSGGNVMNWDGVFQLNGVWYFVEAKANKEEAYQKCRALSADSCKFIDAAFEKTKEWLGVKNSIIWRDSKCYQLANRLSFMYFCNELCGIPAKLLYVGFINGYPRKDVTSKEQWEEIWMDEYEKLGITEEQVEHLLFYVYPDCLPEDTK